VIISVEHTQSLKEINIFIVNQSFCLAPPHLIKLYIIFENLGLECTFKYYCFHYFAENRWVGASH
jgi:hypothetical protein